MARRRFTLFPICVVLVSILGSIHLQGCAPQLEDDGGFIEVEEPLSIPIKTAWCEGEEDYRKDLSDLAPAYAPGITVQACFPGGKGVYEIIEVPIASKDVDLVLGKEGPFEVHTLLAYIKVKYQQEYVTEFSTPLEIRITYSADALADLKKRGYAFPRLAYLVPTELGWQDMWIEIDTENIRIAEPAEGDTTRILYLQFDELPDPLIGGC
jgi:hypothetical protein